MTTPSSLTPFPLDLWRDDNPMSVTAWASVRRVSGEPGSLSITAGWDVDIARVTFRSQPIDTTPAEREALAEQIIKTLES